MANRPNYPVESVDKALALLLLLYERPALSVSDAARALEVAPSTAHRLLTTLGCERLTSVSRRVP